MTTPAITYENLFASILSMDAYNRRTNEGVFIAAPNLPPDNMLIGDYKIIKSQSETTRFYAVAYKHSTSGNIIISYRGTDDLKVAA